MKILLNHIGYESGGTKFAIASCPDSEQAGTEAVFFLCRNGEAVLSAGIGDRLRITGWKDRNFYLFDFSPVCEEGEYSVRLQDRGKLTESPVFHISGNLYADKTISDILFYFKSQRCSWRWDKADRNVPFFGKRTGRADVRGGWYDASGDYSKYLSHLSYADYFNPQQTPLAVWALLSLKDSLAESGRYANTLLADRALEEGLYGADFLMRMQDPEGFFYMTVFDQWSKDPGRRIITAFSGIEGTHLDSWQSGYRQGAGVAIAALARAAGCPESGVFGSTDYLDAAIRGWKHLEENNLRYLDNGRENIIDHYCALLAATELNRATGNEEYLAAARRRAGFLGRLYSDRGYWLVEEDYDRPYFHAAEAGLPVIALLEYSSTESDPLLSEFASGLAVKAVRDQLALAGSRETNAFRLAKQWVKAVNGSVRQSFFMPHENETGYWWQGENARLASLSAAARRVKRVSGGNEELLSMLDEFADSQLHWILGCNPFDLCMLQGHGRNNPVYEQQYPNAPAESATESPPDMRMKTI